MGSQSTMRTTKELPWRNLGGRIKLLKVAGKGPQHLDAARRGQRPLPSRGRTPTHPQLPRQGTAMTGLIGKASKPSRSLAGEAGDALGYRLASFTVKGP